ncbi:MAG: peptidase M28 [Cryomorphaceae bacterium]|nr:MAG: peptidase M28 [Cryomorphaceae bacterium]
MRHLIFFLISFLSINAQAQDAKTIRTIYDLALTQSEAYENLRVLCKDIGHRLSGSKGADSAVVWGQRVLGKLELDTIFLQEITVPHWERGRKEKAYFYNEKGKNMLDVCALGGSISTGMNQFIKGDVLEVKSLDEVNNLPDSLVKGKIIFYNRPMDPKKISTFSAYGSCVDQRYSGAIEAAKKGAIAVIVRSMNVRQDDFPHTGSMAYEEGVDSIPAFAISTNGANYLSENVTKYDNLELNLKSFCKSYPDKISHNVIGEIKGSEFPDEYITVGGHLDSWDMGEGAHDDGAGVVQSIEVLHLLNLMNIKPKHSIRVVLFMNEENGNRGGKHYAERAAAKNEKHLMALESDRGGFSPRGFSVNGTEKQLNGIKKWGDLFEPFGIHEFKMGFAGVDINPLEDGKICLIGLSPDSQRYFDHHHSDNDVFEEVNKRELVLGAASMTSLIYLIDKYWTIDN